MKKINIPSSENFRKVIEEYFQFFEISECVYRGTMKEFSQKRLANLTETDTKRILEPFLIMWGRMSRVLGRDGCEIVREKITHLSNQLEKYRNKSLIDLNIKKEKQDIIFIFNEFKNTKATSRNVGQTATSKILHIINPQMFPMWDTKIRSKYGLYTGSASDYIDFLIETKRWLLDKNLKDELDDLSNQYQLSKLKIIDQYNWYIVSR